MKPTAMAPPCSHRWKPAVRSVAVGGGAIGVIATSYAVLIWDRTSPLAVSRGWLFTWLAVAVVVSLAAMAGLRWPRAAAGDRSARVRWLGRVLLSAAVPAGAYLIAMYGSEAGHHALLLQTNWRGLSIGAGSLLPLATLVAWRAFVLVPSPKQGTDGRGWPGRLAHASRPVVPLSLLAWGSILAATYVTVATDDLIRYWRIADALAVGALYPLTVADPSQSGFYIIDLPVFPLLLWPSFTLIGHTLGGLFLPIVLAAALVPWITYGCLRQAGLAGPPAYALTAALTWYPPFRIYVLGAAEPEPLFVALLLAAFGAALKASRTNKLGWGAAAGALAAGAALTRPEGLPYTLLLLGGAWLAGPRRWWLGAVVAYALPLAAFSGYLWSRFGVLWPSGWTRVASLAHLWPNFRLAWRDVVPQLAEMHRLPNEVIVALGLCCLALFLLGCWHIAAQRRELTGLVFIPFVTLGVLLTTPAELSADLYSVSTLVRHLGVPLPAVLLVLALSLALPAVRARGERIWQRWSVVVAVFPLVAALFFAGILATAQVTDGPGSVFGTDQVVLARTLFVPARPLPVHFAAGGIPTVADTSEAYHQFRDALYASLEQYDLRGRYDGTVLVFAAVVWLVAGAVGALLALPRAPTSSAPRS